VRSLELCTASRASRLRWLYAVPCVNVRVRRVWVRACCARVRLSCAPSSDPSRRHPPRISPSAALPPPPRSPDLLLRPPDRPLLPSRPALSLFASTPPTAARRAISGCAARLRAWQKQRQCKREGCLAQGTRVDRFPPDAADPLPPVPTPPRPSVPKPNPTKFRLQGCRGLMVKASGWQSFDRQFDPYPRAKKVALLWCRMPFRI
jgi:hypothetical protein